MSKTVQEWMHTKLWSARTTKQICVAILILFVLGNVWIFLQRYWLNPYEQLALLKVLRQADIVRHARNDDLDAEYAKSKSLQELAERRVWTNRDLVVNALIEGTAQMAMLCRRYEIRPGTKPEFEKIDEQMGKFGCAQYDSQVILGKSLLRLRLGF